VPVHEFLFAVDLPAPGAASDAMLADLLPRVLGHIGCGPDVLAELMDAVRRAAVETADHNGRCDVQLRAVHNEVSISVTAGGRVWRTSRAIP
jgi:hypothetical protein